MSKKQACFLIAAVIFLDQTSKFYIKTHFVLGQEYHVLSWFRILFVENDGMAWGAKLSDFTTLISERNAKLTLTIFRVLAVLGIGYWMFHIFRIAKKPPRVLVVAISLIFSGALGNIIDSVFYGYFFSSSSTEIAQFIWTEGYADLFFGNVVDMLYFPIFKGYFPYWVPFVGGDYFTFFDPVFNIADVSISTGVALLLLFNKTAFPRIV